MTLALGMVRPGSTITIPFNTFDSNDPSASVIISAFVLADIGIYKGTSMTERASTTGVVLLDTDGINIDGAVGLHGFTIDLSSNATDDFYQAGEKYYVTVGPITIDGATAQSFIAATFEIGYPDAILNTTIATLASQTSFTITAGPAEANALLGCVALVHDQASAVQIAMGYVSAYGTSVTVTLKADPGVFTMAVGDNVSFFLPSNVQAVAGTTQTAGDLAALLVAQDAIITETRLAELDAGNLPTDVAAIDTATMRGTDSAALASVATETRLAELDAGNLPTDIAAIPTTAMRGTDNVVLAGPTKAEMDTAHGLLSTIDMMRGLVQVNGTIGATGNTTTKLHLVGLTYGNDEINGWTLVVFDNSTSEYHQCLVTDWVLSTALATVEVSDGNVLPFTPEASVDKYWLVTPSTTNNIWDRILTGATHNVAGSGGRRIRQLEEATILASGTIATVTDGHTFTLDAGAVATTDYYISAKLQIVEGTGAGQSRVIIAYSSGRVAILDSNFITNPDTSSVYEVISADVHVSVSDADLAEGFLASVADASNVTLDATNSVSATDYYKGEQIVITHGTGVGQAREIISQSGRALVVSPAFVTLPDTTSVFHIMVMLSADEVVDENWDALASAHEVQGSFGERMASVLSGNAATGTLSTTQMSTDIVEATNDHFIGRTIIGMSGVLKYQATDITDYVGTNGVFTFTAVTEAPSNGDNFIIV